MNKFTEVVNGMGAEDRQRMIDDAKKFVESEEDFVVCVFCKKNITELVCDATIGHEAVVLRENKDGSRHRLIGSDGERFTCDLPVCEMCRTQGSAIFFSGSCDISFVCHDGFSDVDVEGGPGVFVPDLCPIHKGDEPVGEHLRKQGFTWAITKSEAEAWRRQTLMLLEAGKRELVKLFPEVREDAPL